MEKQMRKGRGYLLLLKKFGQLGQGGELASDPDVETSGWGFRREQASALTGTRERRRGSAFGSVANRENGRGGAGVRRRDPERESSGVLASLGSGLLQTEGDGKGREGSRPLVSCELQEDRRRRRLQFEILESGPSKGEEQGPRSSGIHELEVRRARERLPPLWSLRTERSRARELEACSFRCWANHGEGEVVWRRVSHEPEKVGNKGVPSPGAYAREIARGRNSPLF
ncbi:hypothetical protein KFK09_024126 [Dendrobium nobile]|uniref:Uncharacterized protein n=1 Tax=Dendrobium nobile TaxID=94219 RepID=A0A8T3AIG0_DENNO|nr:hypothetical protein KFK09_024126 [Dendrobium nobile]